MNVLNTSQQNSPSFQMKITCKRGNGARTLIKKELETTFFTAPQVVKENYLGNAALNFNNFYKNFQQTFAEMTKGINGTVRLIKHEDTTPLFKPNELLKISFTDSKGKTYVSRNLYSPSEILILPDKINDKGKPISYAVKCILNEVANLLSQNGINPPENKVRILYDSLK